MDNPLKDTGPTGYDGFDDVYLGPGMQTWNGINPEQDGPGGGSGGGGGGGGSSLWLAEVNITAFALDWDIWNNLYLWDNWKDWYRENNDPYLIWGGSAGNNVGGMFGPISISGTRKYWQNMTMGGGGFGQVGGGGIDWSGVANASLGLLGGATEMFFGGAGEYFSAGTATAVSAPLITDGGLRFLSNGARLVFYFTGYNQTGNIIPGNAGAWLGKGVDMTSGRSFNEYGYGQAFGGAANDVFSFIALGGTAQPISDLVNSPSLISLTSYGNAYLGYTNSLFFDFYPLKKGTTP